MVLEYKSLTRTGSNPVSGTGKAMRMTLLGSAGLALGLGGGLAIAEESPMHKTSESNKPLLVGCPVALEMGHLTVKQSTKFTIVLCRQKAPEQVRKVSSLKNNLR